MTKPIAWRLAVVQVLLVIVVIGSGMGLARWLQDSKPTSEKRAFERQARW